MKNQKSRRQFLKHAGMISLAPVLISKTGYSKMKKSFDPEASEGKFEIGVASWGLRKLSFEQVIQAMKDMQLRNISLKDMHLPFDLSPSDLKARIEKMRSEGLNPYAPGVVYMKSREEADQAFEYTRNAGLKMIVGVPDYELLDYVEERIKEYDISVAIHNHGPDNLPYPSPEDAFIRLKDRDPRFGICMDVAHVVRGGMDPVHQIKLVKSRLLDMHIWDVSEATKEGKAVRPGEGVLDFKAVLKTLIEIGYSGSLSIEYGSEAENPVPAYVETKGYMNGVVSGL
jgi:sugar phosphate isomerase/epimerase